MPSPARLVLPTVAAVALLVSCSTATPADRATPAPSGTSRSSASGPAGTGMLTVPRAVHKATVLTDGRILVSGGCTLPGCDGFDRGRASELFDPATGRFAAGPAMTTPRAGHTATLLRDGRVLIVGGYPGEGRPPLSTAEVFDPASNTFRPVGDLSTSRADHTATLLPGGDVLVAGGTTGPGGRPLDSTERFDPRADRFGPGPRLSGPRSGHAAVVSRGRLVLVAGTVDGKTATGSTDVLGGGRWSPGPSLRVGRVKHAATVLPDRTVLVVGGATTIEGRELLSSTEILDLAAPRTEAGPRLSEGQYKLEGAVLTLPDGRVVIAGGRRVDVFDPATRTIAVLAGPAVPRRSFISASLLSATTVLVAGGYDSAIAPSADARVVRIPPSP